MNPPHPPLQILAENGIPVFAMYEKDANTSGLTQGGGLPVW